jgi:hypothetical protein
MESYTKVQKPKEENQRNEIKIAVTSAINKSFRYALKILNEKVSETDNTPKFDQIVVRASENAITKAIKLVEDIKNMHGNLYQSNKIHTMVVTVHYEPKIEGLNPVTLERPVVAFDCILSRVPLDNNEVGY